MGTHVGENFVALHELGDDYDRQAMVVYSNDNKGVVVGHLPKEISFISHILQGTMGSKVTTCTSSISENELLKMLVSSPPAILKKSSCCQLFQLTDLLKSKRIRETNGHQIIRDAEFLEDVQ